MSIGNRKPFCCTFEGCDMDFVSEDHLNWHRKKHEVGLNLSIENKNNEIADQTPTPTRFIRNCEEVGLFQDLQHVNPFDETFKKAIQSKGDNSLHTLSVPETTNDDTLHTPHIFPPMEEIASQKDSGSKGDLEKIPLDDILIIDPSRTDSDANVACIDLTSDVDSPNEEVSPTINIKKARQHTGETRIRVRQFLTEKSLTKVNKIKNNTSIIKSNEKTPPKLDSSVICLSDGNEERLKIREMNRAAQKRCRNNKKMKQKRLEYQMRFLLTENEKLRLENALLKQELNNLKKTMNRDSTESSQSTQDLQNAENDTNKEITQEKTISSSSTLSKRLRPIRPAPLFIPSQKKPAIPTTTSASKPTDTTVSQLNTTTVTSPMISASESNTIIVQMPSVSGISTVPLIQNPAPILLNSQPIIITGAPNTVMPLQSSPVIQSNTLGISGIIKLL